MEAPALFAKLHDGIIQRKAAPLRLTKNIGPAYPSFSETYLPQLLHATRKALLAYQPISIRCATLPGIVDPKHHEVDQTFIDYAASNSRLDAHDDKA